MSRPKSSLNLLGKQIPFYLIAPVIASIAFVGFYLYVSYFRIIFPFELEWLEGSLVDETRRAARGEKLYVAPSLEFIPYLYGPVYFYLAALVSKVVGEGFLPLRLLSWVASVGFFGILFRMVWRETGSRLLALLSVGLFVSTHHITQLWFSSPRVDCVFIFFSLAGLYLVKFHPGRAPRLLAALLLILAVLTKQSAIAYGLGAGGWILLKRDRGWKEFCFAFGFGLAASLLTLNWIHDGWFYYYLGQPMSQPFLPNMVLDFWTHDLLSLFGIATVLSWISLVVLFIKMDRLSFLFYAMIYFASLAYSYAGRLHEGSGLNSLLPIYLSIALIISLALPLMLKMVEARKRDLLLPVSLMISLALLLQFYFVRYDPRYNVPPDFFRAASERYIRVLAALPGDVYAPYHGYIPHLAGKKGYAHVCTVWDILRQSTATKDAKALREALTTAFANHHFGAVVLNRGGELESFYVSLLKNNYTELTQSSDTLLSPMGLPLRIFLPNSDTEFAGTNLLPSPRRGL